MTNTQESISWNEIKEKREEVKGIYPSIFKVPLIYGARKQLLFDILKDIKGKVFDIGAGDRFVEKICADISNEIEYKSMDVDSSRFHDFYSLGEIQEEFDIILLLDIIEHLSLVEGKALLRRCSQLLKPEGKIVVTVPNNNHPTAFGVDCTHITSYRYHDLGGLLLSLGFTELQIFRVSAKRKLKHRLLALFLMPVMKFLDIDFTTGILIVAKKETA